MTPSSPHQQEQDHQQQQQQQQQQQHVHPFPDLCITQNSRLKSCEACRLSNRKCSRDPVCTRCAKKGSACVYSRNSTRNKAFRALKKSREWTAGRSASVDGANAGPLASTPQPKAMESPGSVMSTTPTTAATTTATARTRTSRRQGRNMVKEEQQQQQIHLLPLAQPKEKNAIHPVAASSSARASVARASAGMSMGVSAASSSTCTITTQVESCNDFLLRLLSPVEMAEISHSVPSPVLIPPRVDVDASGAGVPLMGVTDMRPPMASSSFFFNEPNSNYMARNAFHTVPAVMPGRRQIEMHSFSGGMMGTHGTMGLSADVLAGTSGLLQLYGTNAGALDPRQMSTESLVRWLSTPIYEQMGVVGSNNVTGLDYELQPMPETRKSRE
ncbi:hypothetical protein BJ741DRAFT_666625 [Chytriomyces cf. hyalinus JEL632]|nr:hypothetical protein BJ741DRAFT_666625 [Chytriomyces cf. hyalinus JEL632]